MALVRNCRSIFQNPGSFRGSFTFLSGNFIKGGLRNRNAGAFTGIFSAYPSGALNPNSFILPQKPGAMSSRTMSSGAIGPLVNLIPGMPIDGSSSMSVIVTNAQLDQIVSFVASALLSISGTAQINAAVGMQASAVLALTTSANIQAIISTLASSSMTVSTNSVLTALGHMNAEAGGPTALSPEGLAEAVWGTLSSDYLSASGTFGYQLANSGTGLSPIDIANAVWDKDLSTLKASELLDFLEFINTKVNELHKINGLDSTSPMTVTESNRVAGSITQNFSGDGISTTTVTRV